MAGRSSNYHPYGSSALTCHGAALLPSPVEHRRARHPSPRPPRLASPRGAKALSLRLSTCDRMIDVAGKNLAGAGGVGGETEDAGSALVRSSRTGEGRATSERCARMTCMCARGRCLRVPSRARSRPGGARLLRGGTRAACGRGHCGPRHRPNYHSRCTTVRAMAHAQ